MTVPSHPLLRHLELQLRDMERWFIVACGLWGIPEDEQYRREIHNLRRRITDTLKDLETSPAKGRFHEYRDRYLRILQEGEELCALGVAAPERFHRIRRLNRYLRKRRRRLS